MWAYRRRRYTRRPLSADLRLDDPDLAPMPKVVDQIRRALRRRVDTVAGDDHDADIDALVRPVDGDSTDQAESNGPEDVDGPDPDSTTAHDTGSSSPNDDASRDEHEDRVETQADQQHDDTLDANQSAASWPVVPSLAHPLQQVWPPAGLGLTGPGAPAAARGFLAAGLAAGGRDDPDARTWAILPAPTAAALLATTTPPPATPRLTVTNSLDDALELLEAQTLHRSRLLHTHDLDTVTALREVDPAEEPLPPILLLAQAPTAGQRTRLAALLAQGQRLDIHGVLLGDWPDGDTIAVADDGTTTPNTGDDAQRASRTGLGRLATLTPAQTAYLLVTLAESHAGQPPDPTTPATATPSTDSAPQAADPAQKAQDTTTADHDEPQPADEPGAAEATDQQPVGRVAVEVLGEPRIVDATTPPLRKKSLELLVYLAVHDGQATVEAILDDLLPDAPTSKAHGRLYTYISDLRATMRRTGGQRSHLTHPRGRYSLNTDTVQVDLWQMRTAIRDAERATDPQTRIAALRRAAAFYAGPLADGCDYDWIEPHREAVRQQALDVYLALADALIDFPQQQLSVLHEAIDHNPYVEELYRQAMRAHATLRQPEQIRALRRRLAQALNEIDAEPNDDTITLADLLIAQLQTPTRSSRQQR
ncbi:MAG: BTAD domain-containing putative transcriptional regulator [Actinocatenispora sp.]